MDLRKRYDTNALGLARRVEIVLCFSGKHSYLQGLEKHNVEHCLTCPLLVGERGSLEKGFLMRLFVNHRFCKGS